MPAAEGKGNAGAIPGVEEGPEAATLGGLGGGSDEFARLGCFAREPLRPGLTLGFGGFARGGFLGSVIVPCMCVCVYVRVCLCEYDEGVNVMEGLVSGNVG